MRQLNATRWAVIVFVLLGLICFKANAADSAGVLDDVTQRYQSAASGWASAMQTAATRLFWSLAVISMVWTFGFMAFKKADISEFFAEFIRFFIFTGLFFWLLTNGPAFATAIMDSLKQLGSQAGGAGGLSPSGIVDVGFNVFSKVIDNSSMWKPAESMCGILIGAVILCVLALIAVNMVILLVSGWILAYGGIFFLGFGGSRWTSEIAINYFKTVLGVGASLMGMVLIVGIGKEFIDSYYAKMDQTTLKDMGVMLVASLVLLLLSNKIPSLIAGIITGASVGGASGMGSFGAGAVVGAAAMAGVAAAAAGAAVAAGASNLAGAGSAIKAAMEKGSLASQSSSGGGSMVGGMGGGAGGGASSSGGSAFAQAMGDSGSTRSAGGAGDTGGGASAEGGGASAEGDGASAEGGGAGPEGAGDGQQGGNDAAAESPSGKDSEPQSTLGAIGAGIAAVAKSKAGSIADAARLRVSQTAGGRIAAEIRNPGTAAQTRQAKADIARSQTVEGRGQAARAFVATGLASSNQPPTFAGNSLSGSKGSDTASEIDAFTNKSS